MRNGKVFLTGSTGFLGKYLREDLTSRGYTVITDGNHLDLTNYSDCMAMLRHKPFKYILHTAGVNGGISWNKKNPAIAFSENTLMAINVLNLAKHLKQECPNLKVVSLIASCGYPAQEELLHEKDYLKGEPHPSVEGHAYAKRNLLIASRLYAQQFGLKAICVCPTTLYGPGMLYGEDAKVMGSIMAKVREALVYRKKEPIQLLGDGSPLREFIHVKDASRYIIKAMETYENTELPLNIGTGQEVSIKELADLIAEAAGWKGGFSWENPINNGQKKKRLCLERFAIDIDRHLHLSSNKMEFGPVALKDGIWNTWKNYWSAP